MTVHAAALTEWYVLSCTAVGVAALAVCFGAIVPAYSLWQPLCRVFRRVIHWFPRRTGFAASTPTTKSPAPSSLSWRVHHWFRAPAVPVRGHAIESAIFVLVFVVELIMVMLVEALLLLVTPVVVSAVVVAAPSGHMICPSRGC